MLQRAKFITKRLKRYPLHRMIRDLVTWSPLEDPVSGYTVLTACMRSLPHVAIANLRMIQQLRLEHITELLLVFDCAEQDVPASVHEAVAELGEKIPTRVLGYDERQSRVAQKINWGWVFSWLSWSKGLQAARTRHVILHDLDAMPIQEDLFDVLYANAQESGARFQGILPRDQYRLPDDRGLAGTYELVVDAAFLRERFEAFDAFNRLAMVDGRCLDFDTFLWMQWMSPGTHRVTPVEETALVHPSQLICQFVDFTAGRNAMTDLDHNLLFLPYLIHLGGNPEPLESISPHLADAATRSVPFAGKPLPLGPVPPEKWAWFEKQIRRLEQFLFDRTREEIEAYLSGMIVRAGDKRTVGRETGKHAVPAR